MSMDTDLNRIATALEELVKIKRGSHTDTRAQVATVITPATSKPVRSPVASSTATLGKGTAKAVEPSPVIDPLTGDAIGTAEPITQEQVHLALQGYMAKNGVEAVKGLMIKHGANKAKPTITSLPATSYNAVIEEASA